MIALVVTLALQGAFVDLATDGDVMAWADATDDGTWIRWHHIGGQTVDVTRVPAGATVQSLDVAGHFVAWSDDRFGDLEVFLGDARDRSLHRITTSPQQDTGVAMGDLIVWMREGDIMAASPDTKMPLLYQRNAGIGAAPDADGEFVAWSQAGTYSTLLVRNARGDTWALQGHEGFDQGGAVVDDGRVLYFNVDTKNPDPRIRGRSILSLADLASNETADLTGGTQAAADFDLSGPWIGWRGEGGLRVENTETGGVDVLPDSPFRLAANHIVFIKAGQLEIAALGEGVEEAADRTWLVFVGLGIAFIAAGFYFGPRLKT